MKDLQPPLTHYLFPTRRVRRNCTERHNVSCHHQEPTVNLPLSYHALMQLLMFSWDH